MRRTHPSDAATRGTVAASPLRRLAVLLAALTLAVALAGPTTPARADVRAGAAWSVRLAPREWAPIPANVCAGYLPTDYEAWSARTGRRVGDERLFHAASPSRIVGSSYRGAVRAYVWCDADADADAPWPMPRIMAVAAAREGSR